MGYEKLMKEFNELSGMDQWAFVLKSKELITLTLDNDNTTFTFDAEDKEEDCSLFSLKADIGNRWGLDCLLPVIGIKADHC